MEIRVYVRTHNHAVRISYTNILVAMYTNMHAYTHTYTHRTQKQSCSIIYIAGSYDACYGVSRLSENEAIP